MTRLLFALVCVCGCKQLFDLDAPTLSDAPVPDAESPLIDAPPVDATASDAVGCVAAPMGCVAFSCPSSTSCYYLCGTSDGTQRNWASASMYCAGSGAGCLVTIDSKMENDCVKGVVSPSLSSGAWIGYGQDGDASEPSGGWSWQCNAPVAYESWAFAQPDDTNDNEDCAIMTLDGVWNDLSCSSTTRFVCEPKVSDRRRSAVDACGVRRNPSRRGPISPLFTQRNIAILLSNYDCC